MEENYSIASPFHTNLAPKRMTLAELTAGIKWLANRLYHPAAFGERLLQFIRLYPPRARGTRGSLRPVDRDALRIVYRLSGLGPAEKELWERVTRALEIKPQVAGTVVTMLFRYMQIRFMYERERFWNPALGGSSMPFAFIPSDSDISLARRPA